MTSLVHYDRTYLALIALFADSPDEFLAMGAKSGLTKEECHELVTRNLKTIHGFSENLDLVDFSSHSTTSKAIIESPRSLLENSWRLARILWRL